jgi:DNA methylase
MNWAEVGRVLALGGIADWPDPAPLQGLSPAQRETLEQVWSSLPELIRSGESGQAGIRWGGEGWIWREEDPAWAPLDPTAEARGLLERARALLWRRADAPLQLLAPLEALLRAPLEARVARHAERLAAWTAPAQVLRERWLLAGAALPEALLERAGATERQAARWSEEGPGVVDTSLLDPELAQDVVEAVAPARRGLVLVGDNAAALRALGDSWSDAFRCAYLDPPYNTGSRSFAYRDHRPREAWLSFMDERLGLIRPLLTPDGTLYAQIDQHEQARLRLLLDRHLHFVTEIVWRIGWVSGFKTRAKRFIRNHDLIFQFGRRPKPHFNKRYLPYPEGYVRRDGKPPTGKGIPLEDTWNCSAQDRLDSVQIMSFSREKVGQGDLTQKNEALLARMFEASSDPEDWVLDPFLGSGTSAAVALKLGRRFVGVERDPETVAEVIEPRLRRVLAGDPYGISRDTGWSGGGVVQIVELGPSGAAAPAQGWR